MWSCQEFLCYIFVEAIMDEIKPAPGSAETKKQTTGNAPDGFSITAKETPQNSDTKEATDNQKKTDGNLAEGSKWATLRSRIWLWIKHDTSSTDWLIVVLTAVIAGTSYLQWREIRSGGTDTHDLAVAAKTQADKMQDMSDAADKIRQAAENMVTQEQRIAGNAQQTLKATTRQAKTALDASIAASTQANALAQKTFEVQNRGLLLLGILQTSKTTSLAVLPKCRE
jgi:hypothetical protein